MKTNKAIHPSVTITLDDVIFSNRNQAYGAYYLRKKYNKHLLYSLLLIIFLFGTGATIPLVWKLIFPKGPAVSLPPPKPPVTIVITKTISVPLPPPPKTDPPREVLKTSQFITYVPVDSVINHDTASHISLPQENYVKSTGKDTLYVNIDTSNHIIPPEDTYFAGIGEPATFEGEGLEKFHDWVQENIVYPYEASSIGIAGRVFLNFVVNNKGEVCNVEISRGVHPSINEETVKVLLNSPKWHPAKQNGTPVKQRFYMQVKYEIQ